MPTQAPPARGLNPTLWRTCRVLANRRRLALLQEVWRRPGQAVSAIAMRVNLPAPLTSRYLRDLNARGLLGVTRCGSFVYYRLAGNPTVPDAPLLAAAVDDVFRSKRSPIETMFRDVTALTHPRRIEILQALMTGAASRMEVSRRTGISWAAVSRHMKKLVDRGFVRESDTGCELTTPPSLLGGALMNLAGGRAHAKR